MEGLFIWPFVVGIYIVIGIFTGGLFYEYSESRRLVSTEKSIAQGILSGVFWPIAGVWFALFWAGWIVYYAFKREKD